MLARPRLQVLLQFGAGGADVVRPLQRLHPLIEGPFGGREGSLDWGGGHVGGEYSRGRGRRKGARANCPQIHLNLYSRFSAEESSTSSASADSRAPRRPASRPAGRGNSPCPPPPRVAPAAMNSAASRAARRSPPCRSAGSADRGAHGAQLLQRDRPHRRAREAPWPAASAGSPVAGSIALAFRVLISETASAPPSSAATATAAGSATLGVSFTISGFAVSGRSASSSAAVSVGCSPTIRPEWTLGQETLSSIAATSSRSADAADQLRELLPARRHHRDDQRHRQLGQPRQVLGEEALQALVRQPDRVDHPGRGLPDPPRLRCRPAAPA